ncbi:LuxR family transcriptional regulator [Arachnia propionica]|uniref:LuxR family transcriptional regulator n=2 Tax=Arachnia propionica TaxID=1750 RepID=A0A3P1WWU6_9ACTN|nr:LuxR family transcriptional regulator [Arachnia propionica]
MIPGNARPREPHAHVIGHAEQCVLTVIHEQETIVDHLSMTVDDWAPKLLPLGVTSLCVDDRGMFHENPQLLEKIEHLVSHGMQVVVATENAEDEFHLVARLSHLRPELLIQSTMPPEEVWRIVEEQTGATLTAHRGLIETVCACHPILVHLFLTALCHVRGAENPSSTSVIESLADAVAHVVQTQFIHPEGQAAFMLRLAATETTPLANIADELAAGKAPGSQVIRQMAATLASETIPQDLRLALWDRLRTQLGSECFDLARETLLPFLADETVVHGHHLGILELLTQGSGNEYSPQVLQVIREVIEAASPHGCQRIFPSLPSLLRVQEGPEAAAQLAALCADVDMAALRPALDALNASEDVPDSAFDVLSPLVALEYPRRAARLAETGLRQLSEDDPRIISAALIWIMTSPATACTDPDRRRHALQRIVRLARNDCTASSVIRAGLASLRAFTHRSACKQLRELVTAEQSLSSGGMPVMACCLAGLATSLNNMAEQAVLWCWRARALASAHSSEHIWVLIVHALVAYRDGDTQLAAELLKQVEELSNQIGVATVSRCCHLAIQFLHAEATGGVDGPVMDDRAHAVLRAFSTYCAAIVEHQNGSTQAAIDGHFSTGKTLASSCLTNPMILDWQNQLKEIFLSRNDEAIAECLKNDISNAEAAWRTLNDLAAGPQPSGARTVRPKLSKSEMRVAEQIAAGCTNAQAADVLFLSKRTIDTHLRNIYRRLSISSREELIDFLRSEGLVASGS